MTLSSRSVPEDPHELSVHARYLAVATKSSTSSSAKTKLAISANAE